MDIVHCMMENNVFFSVDVRTVCTIYYSYEYILMCNVSTELEEYMTLTKSQEEGKLTVAIEGRLDTNTAPEFEADVKERLDGVTELVLDMKELVYLSSAGLRVILATQKIMNKQGAMKLCNVNKTVMEVFEITGFLDILTIE